MDYLFSRHCFAELGEAKVENKIAEVEAESGES